MSTESFQAPGVQGLFEGEGVVIDIALPDRDYIF
jgi:hypothetical protein